MSFRPCSCLTALCLSVLGAGEAAASPSWLELRWPEQAGCPTRAEVEAIALRLADGQSPQPVAAEALLSADADGFTLQLHVRDGAGEQRRTLQSPRCEALADATAVILAVAAAPLDVAARLLDPPPPPPPSDPLELDLVPAPSPSPSQSPLSPPPSKPPVRRPGLAVGFGAAAGLGPTARFAAGLSGNLSLVWRRVRLDLRGSGWLPSPLHDADHPSAGATLRLAAGAVRGCPRLVRRTLALELCAGVELGALRAEGVGLTSIERTRGLWAAGLLAPGLQWRPLRWLVLGVEVEALVAFTRRSYAIRDGGVFHVVPPAGVRLGGGIAVQFF
ncbi:hypothetical protein [Nannocystis punicea]|uniref:Uncharacterized protein n=1 Tax=Nannocystis punicea TaxID=2995304 RepID=A0ABY7HJ05_9BACT|nr:hypothetical protein [Nannocystis poenicansa]WAS99263.1 hypothetical protein O0S08_24305 [Nannocystis poenicansa]